MLLKKKTMNLNKLIINQINKYKNLKLNGKLQLDRIFLFDLVLFSCSLKNVVLF